MIINSEKSTQQCLHDIARQREQLQQLEIEEHNVLLAGVLWIQSEFDEQEKQHAIIFFTLLVCRLVFPLKWKVQYIP